MPVCCCCKSLSGGQACWSCWNTGHQTPPRRPGGQEQLLQTRVSGPGAPPGEAQAPAPPGPRQQASLPPPPARAVTAALPAARGPACITSWDDLHRPVHRTAPKRKVYLSRTEEAPPFSDG